MRFIKFGGIALAALVGYLIIALSLPINVGNASSSPIPPWFDTLTGDLTTTAGGNVTIGNSKITTVKINAGAVTESKLDPLSASVGGLYAGRWAFFVYDVAVDGGTINTHTLAQTATLPAKAVILRSFFKIITQFSDSGAGTVALFCEDANNIKTATDITGSTANTFVEGESTGAASAFVRGIGAACDIKAVVAGADQATGKLIGWVQYVVEN